MTTDVLRPPTQFPWKWLGGGLLGLLGLLGLWLALTQTTVSNLFNVDAQDAQAVRAFPGCEGFGCETTHARVEGSVVCVVDTLSAQYTGSIVANRAYYGSFRWCLQQTVPRFIVFKISGTLYNTPSAILLRATNDRFAVLGQTSPQGFAIAAARGVSYNDSLINFGPDNTNEINAGYLAPEDFIVRYIRIRHGNDTPTSSANSANFSLSAIKRAVFDHVSMTWSDDELFTAFVPNYYQGDRSIQHVTFSCNIMGHGVYWPERLQGGVQLAQNLGPYFLDSGVVQNISWHRNMQAHMPYRNPLINTESDTANPEGGFQFHNNICYNAGSFCIGLDHRSNVGTFYVDAIKNYYRTGPGGGGYPFWFQRTGSSANAIQFHAVGNTRKALDGSAYGASSPDNNNYTTGSAGWINVHSSGPNWTPRNQPMPSPTHAVTETTADQAYQNIVVNRQCGTEATAPGASMCQSGGCVDAVDDYFLSSVPNMQSFSWAQCPAGSNSCTGSYPDLQTGAVEWTDTDLDGLPDDIETLINTDPNSFENHATLDSDGDGYMNIEDWSNYILGLPL